MPALALIGLLLTVIKVAIQIADFLKDHPEIPREAQSWAAAISKEFTQTHDDFAQAARRDVEAP